MENLFETFHRHFELKAADTAELLDLAYALRYQVYCVEHPYEDPAAHPCGKETDQFDTHSVHTLVTHRETGICAGVVRLILSDPRNPADALPMERQCSALSDLNRLGAQSLPRHSIAEISRFAISKWFKRCIGDSERGGDGSIMDVGLARQMLPHVILGVFAAIVRMSAEFGITHWYAVMEPTLLRLLTRFGIQFQHIGPLVDYHGKRQPTMGAVDEVLAGIYRQRRDVWDFITDFGRIWPAPRFAQPRQLVPALSRTPEPAFV